MEKNQDPVIDVSRAAKLLGVSRWTVTRMCQNGLFKTAHKPGMGKQSWWKLSRLEVLERKNIKSVTNKSLAYA